jgi:predicted CXXCH cytochrome family protein
MNIDNLRLRKGKYLIVNFFAVFLLCLVDKSFANTSPLVVQAQQACIHCHSEVKKVWDKSDHAKSMALPDSNSVLADFNNIDVEHYGQKAHFFIQDKKYKVAISYVNKVDTTSIETYLIKYTFGHFPLQQYLVETDSGKLQVLPFAWDARTKLDGGQRWYHNYSHEEIKPEDRLHWRQPLQNWNGMCADCHSDGLKRNYKTDSKSFNTVFDNINVGCLSCHGDMPKHEKHSKLPNSTNDINSSQHPVGQWLRDFGDETAHWKGEKRDNRFMENCFSCHALRSPLTDGFKANKAFLDQFMPQLVHSPLYFADGQIKEEVYVYGSFLQSKMYVEGVNCLDCHDKHSMKLKIEGNGLCLQCHGSEVFNVKSHHQHQVSSEGSQCVNCHMPTKRYMGVDDRRDHSFKIPRPDLSVRFNTPNACTQCHEKKSNQWANDYLKKWHGKPKSVLASKQFLMQLNSGKSINIEDHLSIIADTKLDVISRASALNMLSFTTKVITAEILKPYLEHQESLLRLSAANVALLLTSSERVLHLSPLLSDKYKAVRLAAARSLITNKIAAKDLQSFNVALTELFNVNDLSAWRGESKISKGSLFLETNNLGAAESAFKEAIEVDPYFEAGYINLADVYRIQLRSQKAEDVLSTGIKKIPKSSLIKYAYGLHFVRQKNLSKAVILFEEAMVISHDNAQYAYTLVLALDGIGQSSKALSRLKILILNYTDKTQLRELGLYLSQKLKRKADYEWFINL